MTTTTTARTRLLGSALALTAALGVAGITAGTAHAAVVDQDSVKIAVPLGKADFGRGLHVGGEPTAPGTVTWRDDPGPNNTRKISARLQGLVYWDDVFSGGYARVKLTLLDASGNPLVSATSGAAHRAGTMTPLQVPAANVDLNLSHTKARFARVETQQAQSAGGPWTFVGSKQVRYGDVGGQ
ncbi:MAG: hypothetical protein ACT4RN_10815 [Pseudonocardia sp.]